MSNFEFNEQKSQSNPDKHGMDFVDAQDLWKDPYLLEIPAKLLTNRDSWLLLVSKRNTGLRL